MLRSWVVEVNDDVCAVVWRDAEENVDSEVERFPNCFLTHPSVLPPDYLSARSIIKRRIRPQL